MEAILRLTFYLLMVMIACALLAPAYAQQSWRGCPPDKKHLCSASIPLGVKATIAWPTYGDWITGRATLDEFAQMCANRMLPCQGICDDGTSDDWVHVCNNFNLCCEQAAPFGGVVPEFPGETFVPDGELLIIE